MLLKFNRLALIYFIKSVSKVVKKCILRENEKTIMHAYTVYVCMLLFVLQT